jgi:MFS transporter, PHS family, inorganic phosphate transporter
MDIVGRKTLQIGGFALLTALFCVIGFGFHSISTPGLIVLFCLCNFISNVGPNTTTFIVPGEVFPTRYRSTAYGISAASGKIGSILSQAIFGPLKDRGGTDKWLNHIMQIYAGFMYIISVSKSNADLIKVFGNIHIFVNT